jgi:hypothetical protein
MPIPHTTAPGVERAACAVGTVPFACCRALWSTIDAANLAKRPDMLGPLSDMLASIYLSEPDAALCPQLPPSMHTRLLGLTQVTVWILLPCWLVTDQNLTSESTAPATPFHHSCMPAISTGRHLMARDALVMPICLFQQTVIHKPPLSYPPSTLNAMLSSITQAAAGHLLLCCMTQCAATSACEMRLACLPAGGQPSGAGRTA